MTASLAIKTFVKTRLLKLEAEVEGLTIKSKCFSLAHFAISLVPLLLLMTLTIFSFH